MLVYHGDRTPKPFTRHREVLGPAPYSVGIIAKPPKDPSSAALMRERLKREDALLETLKQFKIDARVELTNKWVKSADKKFEKNYIKDRVNETLNNEEVHLDKKRLRLRDLLLKEEDEYLAEAEALHDTADQRYEKMKKRAAILKAKREAERQKVVEEKREMQWIAKCEEIRPVLSRRQTEEVFRDRGKQIAVKAQIEQRKQAQEAMYADLWEKDYLAKAAREERQEQIRMQKNMEQVKGLNVQKAAKELTKQDAIKVKEQELKLIEHEQKIIKLEKERAYQEKKATQRTTRNTYNNMMRYKAKRAAIDRQEELALDMKILEEILQESKNEKKEKQERKSQLKKETLQYLQYLKQQAEFEAAREKEIDLMLDAEIKAMWEKRIEQYKLEKESRDRLMREVMEVRKLQIAEKLEEVKREQEETKRDRIMMAQMVEEHLKDEDERLRQTYLKNYKHASDLHGQMAFEKVIADQKVLEERREYEDGLRVEAEFQDKMKQILQGAASNPIYKRHPRRKNMEHPPLSINGLSIVK